MVEFGVDAAIRLYNIKIFIDYSLLSRKCLIVIFNIGLVFSYVTLNFLLCPPLCSTIFLTVVLTITSYTSMLELAIPL